MWEQGPDADEPEWKEVETEFDHDLYEVVNTVEGPYAIGEKGILAADRGDGWEVVLDDGPNVSDNQLNGLAVTDDGRRLWFAGSSGAMGCYDVETRRKYDYSYPRQMTSTWEGITVAEHAGTEKGLVANGSGEILPFTMDGFDINWGVPQKPHGQGAKMSALAASPDGVGYAVDTNGNAYRTTKEDGWQDIGILQAQVKFHDIWAGRNQRVYVAGDKGRLYRYDDSYKDWTPIGVGSKPLRAFDMYDGQMVALGGTGVIYQRKDGGRRWHEVHSPVDKSLHDVTLGNPDIAVGNGGTVLKRPRGRTRHSGKSPDGDNYDGRGEAYDGDSKAPGEKSGGSKGGDSGGGSSSGGSSGDSGSTGSSSKNSSSSSDDSSSSGGSSGDSDYDSNDDDGSFG